MPRRHDPERRERLVDAAIRVVGAGGIGALSHRAVAAEADVPLGSTTYHFATLDDLLLEAMRRASRTWLDDMAAWERGVDPGRPLADELARLVGESLAGDRGRLELEYELYLAALRRPAVRPVAAACVEEMVALMRRRVPDEGTARALVALIDGLLLQYLLSGRPFDRDEVRAALEARVPGPA
ncbi:TetR family transcriptional regulator C-terminal domain-containing protein [Streptomyces sp. HU2014]|uniref:TetR family transcriptional regulator n=1 Tax=Streptomyces albireticuli TaxID=1940 RepID=A0A1Z2L8S6_9ACTN|nr:MULTISPECIES: TetR family transcriptional regulator C-terminal domain-containing protein [Streptomyces]ARZ70710.1 TetR family transcriptional regulator [Streptomyces albireticuli]UQI44201.1 TetR family transcriptional regulator C-terminal domain-containing protein [Streptomyces sp. HU2014]